MMHYGRKVFTSLVSSELVCVRLPVRAHVQAETQGLSLKLLVLVGGD
jgi:hypothetical protein